MTVGAVVTKVPEAEWVPVPAEVGISEEVHRAADAWHLVVKQRDRPDGSTYTFLVCKECDQAVLCVGAPGGPYEIRLQDEHAQLLAHLMQCHGWTRESCYA